MAETIDGIPFVDPSEQMDEPSHTYPKGTDIDPQTVANGEAWAGGQKVRWSIFQLEGDDDGIRDN